MGDVPRVALRNLWTIALLLGAAILVLGVVPTANSTILGNGVVQVGVGPNGELSDANAGGPRSCSGTSPVGIRFVATGCDGISPRCQCEGWGAAYDGAKTGFANPSQGTTFAACPGDGSTTSGTSATTTTVNSKICALAVTHEFKPSASPNLFKVEVKLANTGPATMSNVLYRRVMDWDIEPTATNEFVTITGNVPYPVPPLLRTTDNGFASSDPLTDPALGASCPIKYSIPNGPPLVHDGPCDHGAMFDFDFGSLASGASVKFDIYYGASGSETSAQSALAAVGAEIWSLGECSLVSCGPNYGDHNTFIFGFGHLNNGVATIATTAATTCTVAMFSVTFDPVPPPGAIVYAWTFDDGSSSSVSKPSKSFVTQGKHWAKLTATASNGQRFDSPETAFTVGECVVPPNPPSLHGLGSYASVAGDVLSIPIWATDVDGGYDPEPTLSISRCSVLPPGSSMTNVTQPASPGVPVNPFAATRFFWNTLEDQVGTYYLCVQASDGGPAPVVGFLKITLLVKSMDSDQDGIADKQDNCPAVSNPDQADANRNGAGDICDTAGTDSSSSSGTGTTTNSPRSETASNPTTAAKVVDTDQDGVADGQDNCIRIANHDQLDLDGDHIGDACDADLDGDGVGNTSDNCPTLYNALQADSNQDDKGDACATGQAVASTGDHAGGQPTGGASATKAAVKLSAATIARASVGGFLAVAVAVVVVVLVLRRWK